MTSSAVNETFDSQLRIIRKLSELGKDFKHHHENYAASQITQAKMEGGVWEMGNLRFHFPKHFGFCYGVDRAIDLAFETCDRFKAQRIFLTDQLIHNPFINQKLKERGVGCLDRDAKHFLITSGLQKNDVVFVSAFGTDFRDILKLQEIGCTVVDSTCGAIINVWKRIAEYAKDGFITVVHGKRNHEETRATASQAIKSGTSYIVLENKKEALELVKAISGEMSKDDFLKLFSKAISHNFVFDPKAWKMGMANQTTMLKEESLEIAEILRNAFTMRWKEADNRFRSFDTICSATQDRQDALKNLLKEKLDVMMIVGGYNSSNTAHLAEISVGALREAPLPSFHIQSASDILSRAQIRARDPHTGEIKVYENWLAQNAHDFGITSGASTPDVILVEVIEKIAEMVSGI